MVFFLSILELHQPRTIPLWLASLWYLFATRDGERYRLLGWMCGIPLLAFLVTRGRHHYLAPACPMLLAAGAVYAEEWLQFLTPSAFLTVRRVACSVLAISGLSAAALTLPIAPLNSAWWHIADQTNGNLTSEIGWPDLVATIAPVRDSLPANERDNVAILAGDDGGAGAVNLVWSRLPSSQCDQRHEFQLATRLWRVRSDSNHRNRNGPRFPRSTLCLL